MESWARVTATTWKPRGSVLHGNSGTYWSEPEQAG